MSNFLQKINGTVIVSALVLTIFGVVMVLAMFRSIPDSQSMSLLLGAVVAMATTAVNYWCGSSSGSAAKDATIHAAITNQPPAAVPVVTAPPATTGVVP